MPAVKNPGRLPVLIQTVEIRLENSMDSFRTSYPAGVLCVGHVSIGLLKPGVTAGVGYFGGPAPFPDWSVNSSHVLLRMSDLKGKTYEVTIALKDCEGTVLAENTFIYTFPSEEA